MNKLSMLGIAMILMVSLALAMPNCGQLSIGDTSSRTGFTSGIIGAQGGNNTNLNVTAETQTKVWQGFYGEVMGNLSLKDSDGNTMYSWAGMQNGIVIAARTSNIDWNNLSGQNDCTIDEDITGIMSDRVNNTFNSGNNTLFNIGTNIINSGTACALRTYVNDKPQSNLFEEIIVNDGSNDLYVTKIYSDTTGFDGNTHDYQMIVPESRNSSTTTYYLYAEIR